MSSEQAQSFGRSVLVGTVFDHCWHLEDEAPCKVKPSSQHRQALAHRAIDLSRFLWCASTCLSLKAPGPSRHYRQHLFWHPVRLRKVASRHQAWKNVLRCDIGKVSRSENLKMVWKGNYDKLFMGGEWIEPISSEMIEVISPYTEQPIATVPSASRTDVDTAVAAARRAFDSGPWPKMAAEERIEAVLRLKAILERRGEELSQIITDEMGSPIAQSRGIQSKVPVLMLEAQTEIARSYPWAETRQSATGKALVIRQPKGVAAIIVPWNTPMMATMNKLGPALLSGCTVVLKPAPETPLSAYMLAEMILAAGLPAGVVNVLPADREESEYLALHPGVDKVSFTGSNVAGRTLARKCGELLRPITLELGGKSAGVFLDDADVPSSVEALRMGSFRNSGQVCSLKTRILVSKKREEEVVEALAGLIAT